TSSIPTLKMIDAPSASLSPAVKAGLFLFIFRQPLVKLRSAVAEEAEGGTLFGGAGKIDLGDDHALLARLHLRDNIAEMIGDEGMAIEFLALLDTDAVGGNDRHDVGNGVP